MRTNELRKSVGGYTQWRSKGMVNYAYAKGANCKGAQYCAKLVFLSYNQIENFPLYFLKYVDVYLYTLRVNLMMKL
jgi:hypothetical protein